MAEYGAGIAPDGLTLYFTRGEAETVMKTTRPSSGAAFGPPVEVTELRDFPVAEPSVSGDHLALYLTHTGSNDIVVARRTAIGEAFAPPSTFGLTMANSALAEGSPTVTSDELVLLFQRPGSSGGLFISTRSTLSEDFSVAVRLDAFQPSSQFASISADGLELFFGSGNNPSNLLRSTRASREDSFTAAELVTELSTSFHETGPEISKDGTELFFQTDRPMAGGPTDIWVSRRECIPL
jgi:hypothetical protein